MKKIPWAEIHLYFDHRDAPLPCYLLRLPVELRQPIFSFVLPNDYKGRYEAYSVRHTSLAAIPPNSQLLEEASDHLYLTLLCRIYFCVGAIYIVLQKGPSSPGIRW